MPDYKTTIEGLRRLLDDLTAHKCDCDACPYNPHIGLKWPYGCIAGQARIIEDAIKLLEASGTCGD